VSFLTARDLHSTQLLSAIHAGHAGSQRALSRQLGIALGLTNLLVRRLEACRWIRVTRIGPNRARYELTGEGRAAHERLLRAQLVDSLSWYGTARQRILARLRQLSREWPPDAVEENGGEKPVLFYGADEMAEIAYACLQRTDLTLAGVVDEQCDCEFFGRPTLPIEALAQVPSATFRPIVVTSLADAGEIRQKLARVGCPSESLIWL
jgi:DNA-binding MarR family transcriptional regulator